MKELLYFLIRLVTSPLIGLLILGALLVAGLLVGLVISLSVCFIAMVFLFACIVLPLAVMVAYISGVVDAK
jgi:hypothetical protein